MTLEEQNGQSPLQPPGRRYAPEWHVPHPKEEERAISTLTSSPLPVVLWTPHVFGKTWMAEHLLETARSRPGTTTVLCNFADILSSVSTSTAEDFMAGFVAQIAAGCGIELDVEREWRDSPRSLTLHLTHLLDRSILPRLPGPLLLGLDDADALVGYAFADTVYGAIRALAETQMRSAPKLSQLHLLLCVSIPPARLVDTVHQSPFNVGIDISLAEFSLEQMATLARHYGLRWSPRENEIAFAATRGHPYLTRAAVYEAASRGLSAQEWLVQTLRKDGIMAEYLRRCFAVFDRQPGLREVFQTFQTLSQNSWIGRIGGILTLVSTIVQSGLAAKTVLSASRGIADRTLDAAGYELLASGLIALDEDRRYHWQCPLLELYSRTISS